jgi:hypothetical protein
LDKFPYTLGRYPLTANLTPVFIAGISGDRYALLAPGNGNGDLQLQCPYLTSSFSSLASLSVDSLEREELEVIHLIEPALKTFSGRKTLRARAIV